MIPHTPQEISDYKRDWIRHGEYHTVVVHTDKRSKAKDWCKANLLKHQWHLFTHTDVYYDTFYFEEEQWQAARAFANSFKL